jgi:hypothetical protein
MPRVVPNNITKTDDRIGWRKVIKDDHKGDSHGCPREVPAAYARNLFEIL